MPTHPLPNCHRLKAEETRGVLMILGGIETDQWHEVF